MIQQRDHTHPSKTNIPSGGYDSAHISSSSSTLSKCTSSKCTLNSSSSSSLFARIVSGSVGSILTSLLVTPLEVVKVRQQANAVEQHQLQSYPRVSGSSRSGCGTFILCNGQIDCLLPKSVVPFFDANGRLTEKAKTSLTRATNHMTHMSSKSPPSTTASSSSLSSSYARLGTLRTLRRIFHTEGVAGMYAGLRPTLVMAVPNTVLYFSAYDELVYQFNKTHTRRVASTTATSSTSTSTTDTTTTTPSTSTSILPPPPLQWWIPMAAGGGARLLASVATAPFEFVRTRQASRMGSHVNHDTTTNHMKKNHHQYHRRPGMMHEFRLIMSQEGGWSALYQGLRPTLWRDVPFSAIYWVCLERLRDEWRKFHHHQQQQHHHHHHHHPRIAAAAAVSVPTPTELALQEFVNGAISGMIAACATTPFDVVKTRQQQLQWQTMEIDATTSSPSPSPSCRSALLSTPSSSTSSTSSSMLASLRHIAHTEGLAGLWRGNQARMLKVAPACAIMISSYELGKRILDH